MKQLPRSHSKAVTGVYHFGTNIGKILACEPFDKRGITIPELQKGVLHKGMGVQENRNCTVITLRMKNRRMRWSVNGANNLAKALYRKETTLRKTKGKLPTIT